MSIRNKCNSNLEKSKFYDLWTSSFYLTPEDILSENVSKLNYKIAIKNILPDRYYTRKGAYIAKSYLSYSTTWSTLSTSKNDSWPKKQKTRVRSEQIDPVFPNKTKEKQIKNEFYIERLNY